MERGIARWVMGDGEMEMGDEVVVASPLAVAATFPHSKKGMVTPWRTGEGKRDLRLHVTLPFNERSCGDERLLWVV
jgi:hypothetical protein